MALLTSLDYLCYGLLAAAILLITIYFQKIKPKNKSPPGPWGLPIVGYLPFVGQKAHLKFVKLAEQYGNIFQVYFGSTPIIVLNGHNIVKEALTGSTSVEFASRPDFFINRLIKRKGLSIAVGKYGADYKIRRKILITALTKFTNRKQKYFHETLDEVILEFINTFKSFEGQSCNPKRFIEQEIGKIISTLCFGKEFLKVQKNYHLIMDNIQTLTDMVSTSPILTFLPWTRIFFRKKIDEFMKIDKILNDMCTELIKPHSESFDDENLRDVADAIFKTVQDLENKGEGIVSIDQDDILRMIRELLLGGYITVSTTLLFSLYYMIAFPDVQAKVQKELDQIIADNKFPSINDKPKLPYTDATVLEVLRFSSLASLGIPRATSKDFVFQGYFIPENTMVFPNLWSVHRDPTIWDAPEEFNPCRFLNNDQTEVNSDMAEKILPFGAGRRRCPGESMARLELFAIFSVLMQQFEFTHDPNDKINVELYEPIGKLNCNCQNMIIKSRTKL